MFRVTRLKPNPAGKDRPPYGGPSATQLGAEWVDITNDGQQTLPLTNLAVYHQAYDERGNSKWAEVAHFTGGMLPPGHTVRLHAGHGGQEVLRPEDLSGAQQHAFTRAGYVWNNRQGDTALLFNSQLKRNLDEASYGAYPEEGKVLVRVGDSLV